MILRRLLLSVCLLTFLFFLVRRGLSEFRFDLLKLLVSRSKCLATAILATLLVLAGSSLGLGTDFSHPLDLGTSFGLARDLSFGFFSDFFEEEISLSLGLELAVELSEDLKALCRKFSLTSSDLTHTLFDGRRRSLRLTVDSDGLAGHS